MIPPVKQNIYRLTEDQKAEIRRLWSENKDVEVIAASVGLTRDCMRRHRKALDLPPRNNRGIVFTPEQDAELIRLSATMGRDKLAKHFGVKQDWIATKILRMGLRQRSKPVPPPEPTSFDKLRAERLRQGGAEPLPSWHPIAKAALESAARWTPGE